MMRVTVGSASYAALQGLQDNASKLASLQSQMSSGKKITKPSDNPSGTIQALQLNSGVARNTQYATNANDAIAFMSTADSTYTQIQNLAQQARTLVVQALNTGTNTGTSNASIADQIDGIKSSLVSLSNTTYNGQPIFGGTTSGGAAYTVDGSGDVSYAGDGVDAAGAPSVTFIQGDPTDSSAPNGGLITRQVGPSTTVQINQVGPQVFGVAVGTPTAASPGDLFQLLSSVSQTLRTDADPSDPAQAADLATNLNADLGSLTTAIQGISTAQATEGATYKQVQDAQTMQASTGVALQTQLSNVQDIDLAQMAVQVSTAQVTYQAALQTTASIKQMSLLNFLN